MQKKAQVTGIIVAIAVVIGVIALVFAGIQQGWFTKQSTIETETTVTDCPDSTGILTANSFNAMNKGSNLTPTLTVGVGGAPVTQTATSGTTTFGVGEELVIHASLTDYLDTKITGKMKCGGLQIDNPMYYSTSDNPAIRIINDEGDYMTDSSAGGTNQTDISAGEDLTVTVEFKGTSLESSGEGVYIVETAAGTGSNISRIELDGVAGKSVPSVHSSTAAGSSFYAFDIPAIEGASTLKKSLTFVTTSTGDFSGAVLTDWYAKQQFIDDDGTIKLGIQDSDGTAKYENTVDSDFYVDAS